MLALDRAGALLVKERKCFLPLGFRLTVNLHENQRTIMLQFNVLDEKTKARRRVVPWLCRRVQAINNWGPCWRRDLAGRSLAPRRAYLQYSPPQGPSREAHFSGCLYDAPERRPFRGAVVRAVGAELERPDASFVDHAAQLP